MIGGLIIHIDNVITMRHSQDHTLHPSSTPPIPRPTRGQGYAVLTIRHFMQLIHLGSPGHFLLANIRMRTTRWPGKLEIFFC
ncbi:hypothetical protein ACN38_g11218 [Penicillium nordicum]|uniref:Uncharacterized protein n=1 Tax=Penicillium nordicum TaxID=229535 RepID=A0A0M9WB00_9EURO|nr:hypothetical protein ACN38_g11218 [Penicillium nordicum]